MAHFETNTVAIPSARSARSQLEGEPEGAVPRDAAFVQSLPSAAAAVTRSASRRHPGRWAYAWARRWLRFSAPTRWGRLATAVGVLPFPPYYGRHGLAKLASQGFFSPRARIVHPEFSSGPRVFIDDGVLIYGEEDGGVVAFGSRVHLHRNTILQTGLGGSIQIGNKSSLQAGCQLVAYLGSITIGAEVQIGPNCAFYSYNHSKVAGRPIRDQPLTTRGGIQVGDDVWLGGGVVVLDGARIGEGAVIGAGAVVRGTIPAGAVAAGVPARVVKWRGTD